MAPRHGGLRGAIAAALTAAILAVSLPAAEAAGSPDLVVASIANPPRSVAVGAGFWPSYTVKNKGTAKARRSTTRVYLSKDRKRNRSDLVLTGNDAVPAIKPRKKVARSVSVTVPGTAPAGPYFVIACADALREVGEANERNNCRASAVTVALSDAPAPGPTGPPAPEPHPDPLTGTSATSFADATSFLYTGPNAVQEDVTPGAIEEVRASVLRGRVADSAGGPIGGVQVSVLDHPEFGHTSSRTDGAFDIAVNGGGTAVLLFKRAGYIPVQRNVEAPWQDYTIVDDVVMIAYDAKAASVDLDAGGLQIVRGSRVTDADGTRQATLLFEPGTQATMTLPGGSTQVLTEFDVRATEYTVGASGADAMPGQLPPTSAYTYAAEFTIDEAVAAQATDVGFDTPVISYVENFLDFPVGMDVPTGAYDRDAGRWIPSNDGRVVEVIVETGGLAQIDTDGDGTADDGGDLGIDDAERAKVAELYDPGQLLWRVPIEHFSPWDYNWPYGLPPDAIGPNGPPPPPPPPADQCSAAGCRIGLERQTLGEDFELVGTPFRLHYESERLLSTNRFDTLEIPLSASPLPESLKRIELEIIIAGRTFVRTFPAEPNQSYTFEWDGKDAFGRRVQGAQPITTRIGYVYDAVYLSPAAFSQSFAGFGLEVFGTSSSESGTLDIIGNRARGEITIVRPWKGSFGALDARRQGLGGMTLDIHHAYDPAAGVLHYGDGTNRSSEALNFDVASKVAGTAGTSPGHNASDPGTLGDGGPASEAKLFHPYSIAFAPDGTMFVADASNHRIRRIDLDGTITTAAGSGGTGAFGGGFAGDNGPATSALLDRPEAIAVAPDGTLYIADTFNNRIRMVDPAGTITTIAGDGVAGFSGDGGPATSARLQLPTGVALAPDGSLYVSDWSNDRIRRIENGMIETAVGGAVCCQSQDLPATEAYLPRPLDIDFGPDGSLYIAGSLHNTGPVVWKVGPDGILRRIAGGGNSGLNIGGKATDASFGNTIQGVAATADGSTYFTEGAAGKRVLRVRPDGILVGVAGDADLPGFGGGDGGPAWAADFTNPMDVEFAPDGTLYVAQANAHIIRHVHSTQPKFSAGEIAIASDDGSELYRFDPVGRHLETIDTLTGAAIQTFTYDGEGRLVTVTDVNGLETTVVRDASGLPTAIQAPGGQTTTLTLGTDGLITNIANPAGETYELSYANEGLLTEVTDPRGASYAFVYDAERRLIQDTDRAGGVQTLTRSETTDGFEVSITTDLGRTTTYGVEYLDTGEIVRTRTDPSGAETTSHIGIDGAEEVEYPDGTTETYEYGPDPRFGMHSPVLVRRVRTTPAAITETTVGSRTASLSDPVDPLSLQTLTETATVNGRVYQQVYNAATRKLTQTTPQGRQRFVTLDARARVTETQVASTDPITYSYDTRGRLTQIGQGVVPATSRSMTFAYDAKDRLASQTDATGATFAYEYDDADRVVLATPPSGDALELAWDANGNHTALGMPDGGEHQLGYTPIDRLASYAAPGNPISSTTWDDDRRPTLETLAGGRQIDWSYDAAGRLIGWTHPEATRALAYVGSTDRLDNATRTPSAGTAQTLDLAHDGDLLASLTSAGVAQGSYAYTYNNNRFRTASNLTSAGDASNTAFAYDNDGLVTTHGPFTFTRNGPAGALSAISAAGATTAMTYNALAGLATRTQTVSATQRYREELSYDRRGLISQKIETVGATTHAFAYTRDADGQLIEVLRDGTLIESYDYDENENRISRQTDATPTPEQATYDGQDRLTARGGVDYEFDVDGFVAERGADTFSYSAQGELVEATAGSTTVTYGYDAFGRRTSRTEGVETHQYLYGNPDDPFQVTAVRGPGGVLTVLRYDVDGRLFALERSGTRFHVATDHVGTPRVVTDSAGATVKTLEYDSFGVLLADSDPSFFLPIGFAGGLDDKVTGLVRFGYRDYEPASGRWTARDPILYAGGQANLYTYVANDPLSYRDPSGLVGSYGDVFDDAGRSPPAATFSDPRLLPYYAAGALLLVSVGIIVELGAISLAASAPAAVPASQRAQTMCSGLTRTAIQSPFARPRPTPGTYASFNQTFENIASGDKGGNWTLRGDQIRAVHEATYALERGK